MIKSLFISITLGTALLASVASAQNMTPIVELCSDPLTDGPAKLSRLPDMGWAQAAPDIELLTNLAAAHIIGFTRGMADLDERYATAPVLAQNFSNMMAEGQVTLWTKDTAVLAISIAQTAEGGEHLACYFAAPKDAQTMQHINALDGAEDLAELELVARRFDETVALMEPEMTYKIYSTWARITSGTARGPLTDSYRMERLEQ